MTEPTTETTRCDAPAEGGATCFLPPHGPEVEHDDGERIVASDHEAALLRAQQRENALLADQERAKECTEWHLHMGVRPRQMGDLFRTIGSMRGYVHPTTGERYGEFLPISHAQTDGDGWRCWGESVGTDVNDTQTLHVTVEITGTLEEAYTVSRRVLAAVSGLAHVDKARTIRAGQPSLSTDLLGVLSTKSTWSAQAYLFTLPDRKAGVQEQYLPSWASEWDG